MSAQWGRKVRLTIFGESHGQGVGIVVDGLPAGFKPDWEEVRAQMKRRAPGQNEMTTSRVEADEFEIISGVYQDHLTGAPLCMMIRNTNVRSGDYTLEWLRPGHADFTAFVKYGGNVDMRGGGHFSGRLTAPLVFGGALSSQVLRSYGVEVGAHIARMAGVSDAGWDYASLDQSNVKAPGRKALAVVDDARGEKMRAAVAACRESGDSAGGIIECAAVGVPAGWGEPFFGSVESRLSELLFSIPAVKGVSFGDGFDLVDMHGSQANDSYRLREGKIETLTNHNGGILGGISNGMPIVLKVAIKPTPSIAMEQASVNVSRMEEGSMSVKGRHDPCIVPRAVPVIESAVCLGLLDLAMEAGTLGKE